MFHITSNRHGFRISLGRHFILITLHTWGIDTFSYFWWEVDVDSGVPNTRAYDLGDAVQYAKAQLYIMRAQAAANPQPYLQTNVSTKDL